LRALVQKKHRVNPTVADAILDRLVHAAHRLTLNGDSMRKAAAKRSAEKPRFWSAEAESTTMAPALYAALGSLHAERRFAVLIAGGVHHTCSRAFTWLHLDDRQTTTFF
jgi:hypothetical protein